MVLRCLNGTADFAFSQPYEESGDLTINFNDKPAETAVSACYFSSRVSKLAVSRLILRTLAVQRLMTRDVRVADQSGRVGKTSGRYLTHTNIRPTLFQVFQVPWCSWACLKKSDMAAQYSGSLSVRFDRVYKIFFFRISEFLHRSIFIFFFINIIKSINCSFSQCRTNHVHKNERFPDVRSQ